MGLPAATPEHTWTAAICGASRHRAREEGFGATLMSGPTTRPRPTGSKGPRCTCAHGGPRGPPSAAALAACPAAVTWCGRTFHQRSCPHCPTLLCGPASDTPAPGAR
eukprot:4686428-Prymnesium_polylepis.1